MFLMCLELNSFPYFGEQQVIELTKNGETRIPNREQGTYENN